MNTQRLAKPVGLIGLFALALIGHASHAHERGPHANPYLQSFTPPAAMPIERASPERGQDWRKQRELYRDIEARQRQQMDRIHAGVKYGLISRGEERRLLREQRDIEQLQRRYASDARLNLREWQQLDRLLDQAQRNIVTAMREHHRRWAAR